MPKRQLKLTKEDKEWAKQVKERDGWKCVICGDTERPNAHHLIPRENVVTKMLIENGLTLCPKHHFFCRKISAHNNPIGLFVWMKEYRREQLEWCMQKQRELTDDYKARCLAEGLFEV